MVISPAPRETSWHPNAVAATRNPVVVGIDRKQPAALRFAAEAATSRRVGLHVVHCLEGSEDATLLDRAEAVIDSLSPVPETHYLHGAGSPYETLLAESQQASLVVVGTDSIGRVERLFDGTVTEHLVRTAPVPVAIVPESQRPDQPGSGVVLAADAQPLATGPIHFAFEEASRRGTDLRVVQIPPAGMTSTDIASLRAELARSLAGWPQRYPDVTVTCRLTQGAAGERYLHESEDAGLLVIGRGAGRLGHSLLTQLTRRANCPCIVVPDTWSDS